MNNSQQSAQTEMPRWKCHKEVHAAKITEIAPPAVDAKTEADVGAILFLDCGGRADATVEFMLKHQPQVGGYYVVYADGYKSFSPAEAFEEGYTRILSGD